MSKTATTFILLSVCYCLGIVTPILAAEVDVHADVETRELFENMPVKGLITINHPRQTAIDEKTFKLDNAPLAVTLVKEEPMTATGDLVLSIYSFELGPQPKGAHSLPSVSVKVGGKEYRSIPTTYQIKDSSAPTSPAPGTAAGSGSDSGVVLRFEPFIEGPTVLYPGQQTLVGYNYIFNVNLEATAEETPLLEAKGLIKIGEKIIKEGENQGLNILQVAQIVQGDKPGDYTFGPSRLEGKAYRINSIGQRNYIKQKIAVTAPALTIKVVPFPTADKPVSFNGALGNYTWQVKLLSPAMVQVGDEVSLGIDASGKGDLASLALPELCCQPGISGFFRLSDLPPIGTVDGPIKHFVVTLRPLTDAIKEIPSLEFSSFDPEAKKYIVVQSEPIPLTVKPAASQASSVRTPKPTTPRQEAPLGDWEDQWNQTSLIAIEGNYPLSSSDLQNLFLGTWWSLLVLPLGVGAFIFQINLKRQLEKMPSQRAAEQGNMLLQEALSAPQGSADQYRLLQKALLVKLVEKQELGSADIAVEQLATSGMQGKVRSLLLAIEEKRFSGQTGYPNAQQLKEAKEIGSELDAIESSGDIL